MSARRHDLIILGGGLAGGLAAIAVRQARPEIDVALVERGTISAPVSASHGWKLIAAHAVGGRLSWWTACIALNHHGRCISRWVQ